MAFTPTSIIGLNVDLNMPKVEFKSNAKPSVFAYPPALEEKKDKNKEKVETAVLSITAKQQKRKEVEKKKDDKMEVVSFNSTVLFKIKCLRTCTVVCCDIFIVIHLSFITPRVHTLQQGTEHKVKLMK